MQRFSRSHGNLVSPPCSCGHDHDHQLFHTQTNTNSFSMMFFSNMSPDLKKPAATFDHDHDHYHHHHQVLSHVDCTLSLGTPSSTVNIIEEDRRSRSGTGGRVSNFCWDLLQPKQTPHKPGNRAAVSSSSTDPLPARRCANCDTTSTPLWRNGPRGPKSLCNACGIRFKKEERRASNVNPMGGKNGAVSVGGAASVGQHSLQAQKLPCFSSSADVSTTDHQFRFIGEVDDRNGAGDRLDNAAVSLLSWRLNVTDRPSLVHDFTR